MICQFIISLYLLYISDLQQVDIKKPKAMDQPWAYIHELLITSKRTHRPPAGRLRNQKSAMVRRKWRVVPCRSLIL